MRTRKRTSHLVVWIALLLAPAAAHAQAGDGEGTRTVRRANATVKELLQEKVERGSAAEKKLAAEVTRRVRDFLDIETLGRRALVDHWKKLRASQRSEFDRLLRDLVEANYMRALRANVAYEVKYLGERTDGEELVVRTEVIARRRGRPRTIAIDYRLRREGPSWRAFDVVTDGVGLVENYRAQFNKIIARDGFDGLVERMRKKRATM